MSRRQQRCSGASIRSTTRWLAGASNGTTTDPVTGHITTSAQAIAAATSNACAGPSTTITYDPAPVLGLGRITATYTNEGEAKISGIDAQLDWWRGPGSGHSLAERHGNYYLYYKVKELAHNPLVDYVGTFGTGSLRPADPGVYR